LSEGNIHIEDECYCEKVFCIP